MTSYVWHCLLAGPAISIVGGIIGCIITFKILKKTLKYRRLGGEVGVPLTTIPIALANIVVLGLICAIWNQPATPKWTADGDAYAAAVEDAAAACWVFFRQICMIAFALNILVWPAIFW